MERYSRISIGGAPKNKEKGLSNTLSEEDVADSGIHVVLDGLTGLDHVTVTELHALGTLGTQLTRDDDLATSGSSLHDETEDTIACTA
jgi:hypothetical protein